MEEMSGEKWGAGSGGGGACMEHNEEGARMRGLCHAGCLPVSCSTPWFVFILSTGC
jgi:hypothetical protein